MRIILQTERLTLRQFTGDDADNLFRLNSDPEVMRFLTGGRPTPREVLRDEVIPFHLGVYERLDRLGTWAAESSITGEFPGWFHMGFTHLGVRRVFAHTMAVNAASRRVLEKCGLMLVHTTPYDGPDVIEGSEHGEVEYALTRPEWEARTAGA